MKFSGYGIEDALKQVVQNEKQGDRPVIQLTRLSVIKFLQMTEFMKCQIFLGV